MRAFAILLTGLSLLLAPVQARQSAVSDNDIQRLQDSVYDGSTDISRLRSRDTALARQLETELDTLREEVIYLKVKLRKNQDVTRTEYSDLRDRISNLRSRARGETPAASSSTTSSSTTGASGTAKSATARRTAATTGSTRRSCRSSTPRGSRTSTSRSGTTSRSGR